MNKLVCVIFCIIMGFYSVSFGADTKVSALSELATTPADTDEIYINDGGTSKRIKYTNLTGNKLNTADIDDTPVDSETAAPISSNWAYDHENDAEVHGLTAVQLQELGTATYDDLNDYLNTTGTAGLINGGLEASDDGDGTITVSAGSGYIRTSDSSTAQLVSFDVAQSTPSLTDNALNYVYVDYNAGVPQVLATVDLSSINHHDKFVACIVYKDGTDIHISNAGQRLSCFKSAVYMHSWEYDGLLRSSGLILGETGTRNITITEGVLWLALNRSTFSAFDSSGAGVFTYVYRDGGGGWTTVASQTQINNANYDDGDGTLGTLTVNKYGVAWVFGLNDVDVYVVYGQGDYLLAQAQAATVPSSLPDELNSIMSTFIGKIIIQQGASSFTEVLSPFQNTIGLSVATDHGALGGLSDDDHPQYGALAQNETITGNWALGTPASGTLSNCAGLPASGVGGTTTLDETTAANDSGAYLVGVYDEFDNSSSTNVQDVLDDFDGFLTTLLAGIVYDTTPQLGGNLDVNGKEIQSAGNIVLQLGDNAGTYSFIVQDSDSSVVFSLNSDGELSVTSIDADLLDTLTVDTTADGLSDDTYTGAIVLKMTAGEVITQWDTVYYDFTTGEVYQADADAAGEFPAVGVAVAAGTDGNALTVLKSGFVRNDGWNWSAGAIYLSDTAGGLTQTAPSTSGDAHQLVGFAVTDDEAYFNFTGHWFEVE